MRTLNRYLKKTGSTLLSILAMVILTGSAYSEIITVDLNLVGASGAARPIVPPAKVPQSMFMSGAREVYGDSSSVAGFNSAGAFSEVYPGISMACYTDEHQFEYAFIISIGGDASKIRFQLQNLSTVGTTDRGNIIYTRDDCEIYQHSPIAIHIDDNGSSPVHSSLMMSGNGGSALNVTDFFDSNAEEMNGSRFNIIPGDTSSFGPDYDYYMAKYETTNEQLLNFLNNTESNQRNPRGANMFFDHAGNIWINPDMKPQRDEMFSIGKSKILYDPERVIGDRYYHVMDDNGNEIYAEHPATGISWYGAVKYSNWLTLQSGRGISELCYTEGTNTFDWAPSTATNWAGGFFSVGEREAWLKLRGFRLPMFRIYDDENGNTNRFNEFLKAGSWTGSTNVLYGYGRNSFTNTDANALLATLIAGHETLPVGFFDGLNILNGNRTRENRNHYSIFDLSGNVDEWVNGPPRPGAPGARSVCGGSFTGLIQPLTEERIVQPYACGNFGGFRPVTTFMPDEYTQINVLFCFHIPPEEEEKEEKDPSPTKKNPADLNEQPPAGNGDISHPFASPSGQSGGIQGGDEFREPKPPEPPDHGPTPPSGPKPPNHGPGTNPNPKPPPEYTLTVFSRNPDGDVNIAIDNPDIDGNKDGETTLTRFYTPGEIVNPTAPDQTGNHQFQYWERNGSPSTTHETINVQMLSNQEITAVYLDFIPPPEYTLYVDSTPAAGVPIIISINDNNGDNNGNTSFSRLYNAGKEVTATAPDIFN